MLLYDSSWMMEHSTPCTLHATSRRQLIQDLQHPSWITFYSEAVPGDNLQFFAKLMRSTRWLEANLPRHCLQTNFAMPPSALGRFQSDGSFCKATDRIRPDTQVLALQHQTICTGAVPVYNHDQFHAPEHDDPVFWQWSSFVAVDATPQVPSTISTETTGSSSRPTSNTVPTAHSTLDGASGILAAVGTTEIEITGFLWNSGLLLSSYSNQY